MPNKFHAISKYIFPPGLNTLENSQSNAEIVSSSDNSDKTLVQTITSNDSLLNGNSFNGVSHSLNGALYDGVDDYTILATYDQFNFNSSNFTICMWIKFISHTNVATLFSSGGTLDTNKYIILK